MKAGFTGTREGVSEKQREMLRNLLRLKGATELHHGDCIGADAAAHEIGEELGLTIVIHPPSSGLYRAFCTAPSIRAPRAYLERNKRIVDATDFLIACPRGSEEMRSGTWATVRYARRVGKKVYLLLPTGEWQIEERKQNG